VTTGAFSVVDAMAGGKKAAMAIDKYLGGVGVLPEDAPNIEVKGYAPAAAMDERMRAVMPCLPGDGRQSSFDEVELGLTMEMARAEGERCWACDQCTQCADACPTSHIPLTKLEQLVFGRNKTAEETLLGMYRSVHAGYSLQPDIRKAGVAGGVVTSLLAYGLENGQLDCAIVAGWDEKEPWKVAAKIATTREELVNCSRSKYSVAQTLSMIGEAVDRGYKKIGVVGLPCSIIGLRKMELYKMKMIDNIALMIGSTACRRPTSRPPST
jgi:ferredoxin